MARFFTWATTAMLMVCLSFDTPYIDICLLIALIIPIIRIFAKKSVTTSVVAVIFSIMAFCLCENAMSIEDKSFYPMVDKPITLECFVNGTPSQSDSRVTYPVKMLSAKYKGEEYSLSDNAMVYCNLRSEGNIAKYGDRLEFKTTLALPQKGGSSGTRRYLLGQGVSVICNAEDFAVTNHGTYEKAPKISLGIYALRDRLVKKCDTYFNDDTAFFVKAVFLGEKANMPEDLKEDITRSGISHITSVSGLHLSLIVYIALALFIAMGIKKLKHRHTIIAVVSIVCGVFAAILTGFTPSVRRALLMLVAANSSALLGRDGDSVNNLSLALLVLLIAHPFALYDVRLSLSATAVLGIVIFTPYIKSLLRRVMKEGYWSDLIAVTLSAQIMSAPLTAIYFGTFSVISPITNIIVVPLMLPLMVLGLIFFISPLHIMSSFVSGGVWLLTKIIFKVSSLASSLPFAQEDLGIGTMIRIVIVLIAVVGGIWLIVSSKDGIKRFITTSVACVVISSTLTFPISKSLEIDFINLPRGECSLIKIDNINMLVDCGNSHNNSDSAATIKKHLTRKSIYKIDYLMISTITEGSVYNYISLADLVRIDTLVVPYYPMESTHSARGLLLKEAEQKGTKVYEVHLGDEFSPNERTEISILSPDPDISGCKGNMVFELSYDGKRLLFLGNADSYDNRLITERINGEKFDIVKMSGKSRYPNTDEELISAISPESVFAFEKSFSPGNYDRLKEFLYNRNTVFYPIGSAPPRITIRGGVTEIKEGE